MLLNLLVISGITALVLLIVKLYTNSVDPSVIDEEEASYVASETPLEHINAVLSEHHATDRKRRAKERKFYYYP